MSSALHPLRSLLLVLLFAPALASAQCCDYVLAMHDSYGDGWNGGTLQVSVNGSTVGTYAAAGFGHGHRVGLQLENRPAFFLHWRKIAHGIFRLGPFVRRRATLDQS